MNTILIAEDEKFIRLGLKTMTQRSGVPVGEILEARDGEEALELLKTHRIDLLITDIRMPKLDGIALVEQLNTLPHPPMVLAVSGYEDFNYAVAMLRSGVSDYLLKPVERQKFCEALVKLEARYQECQKTASHNKRQYLNGLRLLTLEQDGESQEAKEWIARYEASFFRDSYVGFYSRASRQELPVEVLCVRIEGSGMLYLVPESTQQEVAVLLHPVTGRSMSHRGLDQLRQCYLEAYHSWQRAFFTGSLCTGTSPAKTEIPTVTAERLLGLVSLSRDKEIMRLLSVQARMVAQGDLKPEGFVGLGMAFIRGLCATYKNLVDPSDDPIRFAQVWDFDCVQQYMEDLAQWLEIFCGRITQEFADCENKQKIRQAVQYVQENFRSPLNMAVVSNHVSMNYSLFSVLFKQYTGTNFVSYLQALRVEETKRLLASTDWRVGEIGRRVGFVDEKHFLKVFKNATGPSPSEYRKSLVLRGGAKTE